MKACASLPGVLEADSSGFRAPEAVFYPEHIANSPTAPRKQSQKGDEKSEKLGFKRLGIVRCGAWALIRSCLDGHTFAKTLDCGREWCGKCRASSHGRRKGRWFSKLQKLREVGFLTVTFPLDRRPRTAKGLKEIESKITGILMRRDFDRGLRRWHTHGENNGALISGLQGSGVEALVPGLRQSIPRWHPHLNFLLDAGYLSPEFLNSLKKVIGETLKIEKVNLYYQYTQDVKRILHWLKYVTRPTFLKREWDKEMAEELYDFRNSGWWGQWEDPGPRLSWPGPFGEKTIKELGLKEAKILEELWLAKIVKAEELRLDRVEAGYFEDKWSLPKEEKHLAFFKKIEVGICPTCGKKLEGGRIVSVNDFVSSPAKSIPKLPDWEKIWDNVWQYKGPPENVLVYNLFKGFAAVQKKGAADL